MLECLPSPQGRVLISSRQGNRDGECMLTTVLPGAMQCRPRSRATADRASRATAVTSMQSGGTEPPMRIRNKINVLRADRQLRASARAAGRNPGRTNPPWRQTSRRASALRAVTPLTAFLAERTPPFSTSDISALSRGHPHCPAFHRLMSPDGPLTSSATSPIANSHWNRNKLCSPPARGPASSTLPR